MTDLDKLAQQLDAPVTLRVSTRARRPGFSVSKRGLEVILPRRYAKKHVPQLVRDNQQWIESALKRAREQYGRFVGKEPPALPRDLDLPCLKEQFSVDYRFDDIEKPILTERPNRLSIRYTENNIGGVFDCLREFVRKRARDHFTQRMEVLSTSTGLCYTKIAVRGQRTRWGSYSSKGIVSLNYKLMFLPYPLVEHVMLHELCHSRHLNHSKRFWNLLQSVDENTDAHTEQLRRGDDWIPDWVEFQNSRN
ncbi:MAG: YgjP-like metallopeptidase domain-containing protein [Pseudomonadota bacterium]